MDLVAHARDEEGLVKSLFVGLTLLTVAWALLLGRIGMQLYHHFF